VDKGKEPPSDWPNNGELIFKNLSLAYNDGTEVLRNLNFRIEAKEKIGIVGRTGTINLESSSLSFPVQ
jgi:ABC-type multidrug transport system fused ATPase/permease subunit